MPGTLAPLPTECMLRGAAWEDAMDPADTWEEAEEGLLAYRTHAACRVGRREGR
jgi:hypothetical protein